MESKCLGLDLLILVFETTKYALIRYPDFMGIFQDEINPVLIAYLKGIDDKD